ncbi:FeoC-like transcriptional regulator [Streptomyces sp. NPDC002537]
MSPLRQVLAAVREANGSVRLDDIARRLGLAPDEVASMVDYWVHRGELTREEVGGGCPSGGCGGCASVSSCGTGTSLRKRKGPLLLTIRPARRPDGDQDTRP